MIDISKADKAVVLMQLYNNAHRAGVCPNPVAIEKMRSLPEMTLERARQFVERGDLDFDYLSVRSLKINLGPDIINEWMYDRDNGEGTARRSLEGVEGVVFLGDSAV